ncbi:MAG: MFS transporter [Desulfovibrio sp.]|nr:MFS transporter [Desulfovibrio sp.]
MDKRKIFLAAFSHFLCDVNTGALPALLPFLVASHGLSYSAVSGLMLANSSLASVIQPMFGLLSDRSPKIWFMPLGIVIAGVGMAALGFLDSYLGIFCAVGISGIGAALYHPAGMRFVTSCAGERQGTGTSLFSIGGNMGFLLAPLMVVALINAFGLRSLSVLAVLACGMGAVILLEARRFTPKHEKTSKPGQGEEQKARNNWPAFFRLTGAIICRSVLMVCLRVFVPLYWIARFAQTETQAALALTLFGLSGICGNFLGGVLADRLGFLLVIRLGYALIVPLMAVFPLIDNFYLAYLDLVLLGFALYTTFSPVVVVGQRYLARNIGFASGITLGLGISIGGLFAPILGLVADTFGLLATFHTMSALSLLGLLFTLILVPTKTTAR